jgi:hypothetical protein
VVLVHTPMGWSAYLLRRYAQDRGEHRQAAGATNSPLRPPFYFSQGGTTLLTFGASGQRQSSDFWPMNFTSSRPTDAPCPSREATMYRRTPQPDCWASDRRAVG